MTSFLPGSIEDRFFVALSDAFIFLPTLLLIFTWRGFIQASTARLMGDRSSTDEGFLTLNPLAHVDLTGLLLILGGFVVAGTFIPDIPRIVVMLILVLMGVRWTYPVVFDDSQFKNYRLGGIITALSGPIAHLTLGALMILATPFILNQHLSAPTVLTLKSIIMYTVDLSLIFGLIDLLPIPPFDGGRILRYLIPYSHQYILDWIEQYSLFIFLFIFFVPPFSTIILGSFFHISLSIKKMLFKLMR